MGTRDGMPTPTHARRRWARGALLALACLMAALALPVGWAALATQFDALRPDIALEHQDPARRRVTVVRVDQVGMTVEMYGMAAWHTPSAGWRSINGTYAPSPSSGAALPYVAERVTHWGPWLHVIRGQRSTPVPARVSGPLGGLPGGLHFAPSTIVEVPTLTLGVATLLLLCPLAAILLRAWLRRRSARAARGFAVLPPPAP